MTSAPKHGQAVTIRQSHGGSGKQAAAPAEAEMSRDRYRDLGLRVGRRAFVRPPALRVFVSEGSP